MTEEHSPGAPARGQLGQYDFYALIARSFGGLLPLVVILILLAIGAWYFVRELSSLQTRLIAAEQKKSEALIAAAQAEASAKSAADRALNAVLAEQAKVYAQQNELSATVSRKIQELVSGQLDNINKIEANNREQRATQAAELGSLRSQVHELEARRDKLLSEADVAVYAAVRPQLIKEAEGSTYSTKRSPLIGVLRKELESPVVTANVASDIADTSLNVTFRAVLIREMFRISSDKKWIVRLNELIHDPRHRPDPFVGDLFDDFELYSVEQRFTLLPTYLGFITDSTLSRGLRGSFIAAAAGVYGSDVGAYYDGLSHEEKVALLKSIDGLLLGSEMAAPCFEVCRLMEQISPQGAAVHAWEYLDTQPKSGNFYSCFKQETEKSFSPLTRQSDATRMDWLK